MQSCLVRESEQASRLFNHTGVTDPDGLESGLYRELLQNASKLYNETLVTCNKTEFLTVRGTGLHCSFGGIQLWRDPKH